MFNAALLKKKGQNESSEPLILTRTPLGPGLPCGPAKPCNKVKTGEEDLLSSTCKLKLSHGEANLTTRHQMA